MTQPNKKLDIETIRQFAINKGWKLVSNSYINNSSLLEWKCDKGHIWNNNWGHIKSGQTCPYCSGNNKPNINILQQHAITKSGKLLTKLYINNSTLMEWQCSNGHTWFACWKSIKNQKSWCQKCSGLSKPNIKELKDYAISKQGKLLSTTYINSWTYMEWECSQGHIWKIPWDNIKQGSWCLKCRTLKTEKRVHQLLEQKLNIHFTKKRIYYDITNSKKFYELDGYNEENKIAFEYNGEQHYIYPHHWHRTEQQFIDLQSRDKNKAAYCIDNGIKLIIVPYFVNIKEYIDNITL